MKDGWNCPPLAPSTLCGESPCQAEQVGSKTNRVKSRSDPPTASMLPFVPRELQGFLAISPCLSRSRGLLPSVARIRRNLRCTPGVWVMKTSIQYFPCYRIAEGASRIDFASSIFGDRRDVRLQTQAPVLMNGPDRYDRDHGSGRRER
jgi:hypothetical protein